VLLDAALLTIAVGLVAGGRLSRLKDLELRLPWAFVLAAAVQVAVMALGARESALAESVGGPAHILTYIILLVGLGLNRRSKGVLVAGVGVLMNFFVIAANGGSMPVDRELAVRAGSISLVAALDSSSYPLHMAATEETRLRPLGDVLPLPLLVPRPKFFCPGSAGDVFVTVGVCWLLLSGMGAFALGGNRGQRAAGDATAGSEE
jgi:hypothetical protein